MAMKNILVIGNGFDLYHGRETGYRDFVDCVEAAFGKRIDERSDLEVMFTELCDVNGFFRHFHFMMPDDLSWTFFESEMEGMIRTLEHFQDVVEMDQRDPEFDLIDFNIIAGIFTYRDLQIFKHFARIFEQVLDDPSGGMFKLRQMFITQDRTLNKRAMIDEVRRELDDFTSALDLYLTNCVEDKGCYPMIPEFKENKPDYVINFNYTDTVTAYGVPEENIYYAKGKTGSNPANLVLGCPGGPKPPRQHMPDRGPIAHGPGGSDGSPVRQGPEGPEKTGGPMPPLPFMPPMPGCHGGPDHHEDWLYFENDFQKLMKFIGQPDREKLFATDEFGISDSVTVRCFGYSFPMGDAELLRELWEDAEQMVVYYTDREDYAHKVIAMMRMFGKHEVEDAIYQEKLIFNTI